MNANKQVPQADFGGLSALTNRFSINQADEQTVTTAQTSNTSHTSHTSKSSKPATAKPGEAAKTRRTYYYSQAVADRLADAVDELHFASRGRITKAAALNAIIGAGVDQIDDLKQQLNLT